MKQHYTRKVKQIKENLKTMEKFPFVSEMVRELKTNFSYSKVKANWQNELSRKSHILWQHITLNSLLSYMSLKLLLHHGLWDWKCLNAESFATNPLTKPQSSCFFSLQSKLFQSKFCKNERTEDTSLKHCPHNTISSTVSQLFSSDLIRAQPYLRAVLSFLFHINYR